LSFVAMLVALRGMDPEHLHAVPSAERGPGQLRAALRYVWATPALRVPLLMMTVVGTLSFTYQVLLPLVARFTWHGTAHTSAAMPGRVMALYSVAFLRSTPIGAPLVGWIAESAGPRAGLVVGGAAALLTGVLAWAALRRAAATAPASAAIDRHAARRRRAAAA